jgi:hypothetical protein
VDGPAAQRIIPILEGLAGGACCEPRRTVVGPGQAVELVVGVGDDAGGQRKAQRMKNG